MPSLEELNPRQQLIVFIVLGLGLLGAAEYAWLSSMRQSNSQLQQKVQALKTSNAQLRPLALAAPALARSNQFLFARLRKLEKVVPAQPRIGHFIAVMQQQALVTRVKIRQVMALPPQPHQFYVSVPFHVMLQGGYGQIAGFYSLLARLPRIVNVRKITLVRTHPSALPAAPWQTVQADCVVTTFYSQAGVHPLPLHP